jgi:hypothetical protein
MLASTNFFGCQARLSDVSMFTQRTKKRKRNTAGEPQPAGCSDANDSGASEPATRDRPFGDRSTAVGDTDRLTALEVQVGFLTKLLLQAAGQGHITELLWCCKNDVLLICGCIGFCGHAIACDNSTGPEARFVLLGVDTLFVDVFVDCL